jgi:hypothetical protein
MPARICGIPTTRNTRNFGVKLNSDMKRNLNN